MKFTRTTLSILLAPALLGGGAAYAGDPLPEFSADQTAEVLEAVKPESDESRWREVPWLTDVTEARERAAAEDKPIIIFTAADGSPLGRT